MTSEKTLNLRSETVQEILSVRPHWLIRYGNLITVSLCAVLLVMSAFMRYPVYTSVDDFKISRMDSGYVISGTMIASDWQTMKRKSLVLNVWTNNNTKQLNASDIYVQQRGEQAYFKLKVVSAIDLDNVNKMEFRDESTLLRVLMKTVL